MENYYYFSLSMFLYKKKLKYFEENFEDIIGLLNKKFQMDFKKGENGGYSAGIKKIFHAKDKDWNIHLIDLIRLVQKIISAKAEKLFKEIFLEI